MPKETIFRLPGHNLVLGWSKGGLATAKLEEGIEDRSEIFGLHDLDNAISVLQKIRKQVFEVSAIETLLDSKYMTNLVKDHNLFNDGQSSVTCRVKFDESDQPVAFHPSVPSFSASYLYLRSKMQVSPATTLAARKATRKPDGQWDGLNKLKLLFNRDVLDLKTRFDNFQELVLRQALTGRINVDWARLAADVDYRLPNNRFIKSNNVNQGIEQALSKYRKYIHKYATHAYCSEALYSEIDNPEQYGIEWSTDPRIQTLEMEKSVLDPFRREISFVNWEDQPLHVIQGPSADYSAPDNNIGIFSKGWEEKPDSILTSLPNFNVMDYVDETGNFPIMILCEYSFMPVWVAPQVVVLTVDE